MEENFSSSGLDAEGKRSSESFGGRVEKEESSWRRKSHFGKQQNHCKTEVRILNDERNISNVTSEISDQGKKQ